MRDHPRCSRQTLRSAMLLCLLVISSWQVDQVKAFSSSQFSSRTLSSQPILSSWYRHHQPRQTDGLVLFESNSETEQPSKAAELKRSAEQMRLQAEEMEMKLIQEKLDKLITKLDKLNSKIKNAKPEEKEKNMALVQEKIDLTQQIQLLEYRLNPEAKPQAQSPPAAIPEADSVPTATTVEGIIAPSTASMNITEADDKKPMTVKWDLESGKVFFQDEDGNNEEGTNETKVLNISEMSEEEFMKNFDEYADKFGKVVVTIGDDRNMTLMGEDQRNCLWQSKEEEYVGTLTKEQEKLIDEVEQKALGLLKVIEARSNKKRKNPLDAFMMDPDRDEEEQELAKKEELQKSILDALEFVNETLVEARAGNVSKDELEATAFFNSAVDFVQDNVPFVVEIVLNTIEGFNVMDEDPMYQERFNVFAEAYANSLISLRRNSQEDGVDMVFCEEVLDKNPKLFSRTAKPRRIGSAFLIEGKVVESDGNKLVAGLKESLAKSSLKDKVNIFYLRDLSPQIEMDEVQQADFIQNNGGEEDIGRALELINSFETPALLITGPNLETDKKIDTRVGITTFAFLNLVTTIGAYYYPNVEPNYIQEFVAGIQSPILVYMLGTFALQHAIQLLLALKGGFKISPLPTLIPTFGGLPVWGPHVSINSPPKNKNDMFDFGFLAPFVGFLISYGFIVLGLESTMQITKAAEMAQLPHIELDVLKQSFLTSATIESVMGTNVLLSLGDGISSSVPLDPMVIAGYLGLMINSIQLIPSLLETNGGRAVSAALGRFSVGNGGLVGSSFLFLLVQAYRGGSPTLNFVALMLSFRLFFGPEMPCQNDVDTASFPRVVALGVALLLACLTLSPA